MSKVYSFLIIMPIIILIIVKSVLFFEFDSKQKYIKDLTDSVVYKVKITGVLTNEEYNDFKEKLNKLAEFDDASILLRRGFYYSDSIGGWSEYVLGSKIPRGEAFKVYIQSKSVSTISKLHNGGINSDDQKNLYFKAKGQCRVEKEN